MEPYTWSGEMLRIEGERVREGFGWGKDITRVRECGENRGNNNATFSVYLFIDNLRYHHTHCVGIVISS